MQSWTRATRPLSKSAPWKRGLHKTSARYAITNMQMPAMSPTMTEGGIASWKVDEGQSFSAGDVLLEIETDKATIDVEAQEDGVLGKIIVSNGSKNVAVGKIIALLAEEGDDISNLEVPKEKPSSSSKSEAKSTSAAESSASSSQPKLEPESQAPPVYSHHPPKHSRPLLPSVQRLLIMNNVTDVAKIKGTGIRGMLTKGDVLAYLGQASSPHGTDKPKPKESKTSAVPKPAPPPALDGPAIRRLIVKGFLDASARANKVASSSGTTGPASFDSILADYGYTTPSHSAPSKSIPPAPQPKSSNFLDGLI